MSSGAQYVVAAYGVVLFALLIYVVVIEPSRRATGRRRARSGLPPPRGAS